jgi:hypothetical protein
MEYVIDRLKEHASCKAAEGSSKDYKDVKTK